MIIRYRLRRADIWRAYWFPRDRRKLRLVMTVTSTVLFIQAIAILRDGSLGPVSRTTGAMLLFLLSLVGSPLYPLLRFKSDERMLEIGPSGISTTIGKQAGEIAWSKVARIASEGQRLYIVGKTGNSFIVPFEAFSNDAERNQFIQLATQWLNEAQTA
jgi:YcxB-like protein